MGMVISMAMGMVISMAMDMGTAMVWIGRKIILSVSNIYS